LRKRKRINGTIKKTNATDFTYPPMLGAIALLNIAIDGFLATHGKKRIIIKIRGPYVR